MANFLTLLKETGIDNLHKVVSQDDKKYLCFTKINEKKSLLVCVFDGIDMWLEEYDEDSLEAIKDVAGIKSTEAFLLKLRKSFTSGVLNIGRIGAKLTLNLGVGDSSIEFELFEAKAAEKKTWTQSIVFRLAEKCEILEMDLSKASQQIDNLKAQKQSGSGMNALMDFGPKASSSHKPKPPKVGMSAINPSSRKRKAAAGVVFGDN